MLQQHQQRLVEAVEWKLFQRRGEENLRCRGGQQRHHAGLCQPMVDFQEEAASALDGGFVAKQEHDLRGGYDIAVPWSRYWRPHNSMAAAAFEVAASMCTGGIGISFKRSGDALLGSGRDAPGSEGHVGQPIA